MKKMNSLVELIQILVAILVITALILESTGCAEISKNMKEKSVNSEFFIYGLKLTAFDPTTGSTSPTGFVGFGKAWIHTMPVKKGQPYKVTRKLHSFWSGSISDEITIEIGEAPEDGTLVFKKDELSSNPKVMFMGEEK